MLGAVMKAQRRTQVAKIALVVALLGMLASVTIVIVSLVVGFASPQGTQLSRTGTILTIAFLVPVLILAAQITRWRRQVKQQ